MRYVFSLMVLSCLMCANVVQASIFTVHATTREALCILPLEDVTYIGTTGGLLTMKQGDVRHSLPGIAVYSLIQIDKKVLAATAQGVFSLHPQQPQELLIAGPATALLEADDDLWVGRPAGQLERYVSGNLITPDEIFNLPSPAPVFHIIQFQGKFFVATVDGIWRLDSSNPLRQILSPDPLTSSITSLYANADTLYAGTPAGLFVYAQGDWVRVKNPQLAHAFIRNLTSGPDNSLLVATVEAGVFKVDGEQAQTISGAPQEVQTLAVGTTGRILLGTKNEGVWWVPTDISVTRASRFTRHENEIPQNALTCVATEGDVVTVGTATKGIAVLRNNRWQTIDTTSGLTSDWVNQIALIKNKLFVRFSDGTVGLQLPRGNWRKVDKRPDGWPKDWTSALGTDRGALWAGTQNAFYLQEKTGWKILAPKPQLQNVMVLDLASQGNETWLATHKHGVFCWNRKLNTWRNWSLADGLPDTWVQAIEVVGNQVFAGTFSNGVCVFENDRWRTIWPDADITGPDARINCLASAGEKLFAGTLKGLLVVTPQGQRLYTLADGLPDDSIRGLSVTDETLWGATDSGLFSVRISGL